MTTSPTVQVGGQFLAARAAPTKDPLAQQVQQWVGQTFFGTLLKQMREDPFRSEMFDGGRGGQAFTEMYDQQLATHMTRGAGSKLVNAIVHKIEASKAYQAQKAKKKLTQSDVSAITRS